MLISCSLIEALVCYAVLIESELLFLSLINRSLVITGLSRTGSGNERL